MSFPIGLLIICFFSTLIWYSSAICNQCGSSSGVMCISYNTFQFCFNGTASGSTLTCPSNTACSDTAEICSSPMIAFDCAPACGMCSSDGRFACINATTYALCFGTSTPNTSITSTCPTGFFCDITVAAPPFCSNNTNSACTVTATTATTASTASTSSTTTTTTATTASTASTSSTTTTTTTATTASTASSTTPTTTTASTTTATTTTTVPANTYCNQINARDKTRYVVPGASLCRSYVFCFVRSGVILGSYYNCPGITIFNNQTGYCVNPSTYTCPS